MKKMTVALLSFVVVAANAQTADEIIQKYSTAMGGLEGFTKINSAKFTGNVIAQGRTLPMVTQLINGKSMRVDAELNGQQIINVYTNGKGWKINPFAGVPVAKEVTGAELVSYKAQASLANHLMDYKNRGHQVELLGQEDLNGTNLYKLKLTNKYDGKATTYYISSRTFLLVKSVAKRNISGIDYDAETVYTEMKEINGLQFSMHFTSTVEGKPFQEVKYEKIELNIPVDDKIFIMPK